MSVFLVPDTLAGQRINVVASRVMGHSRPQVAELITVGGTLLDDEIVKRASRTVTTRAMLELVTEPRPIQVASRPWLVGGLEIIHKDRDIVVVDKPAGAVVYPSLGWGGPSVTEHLAATGIAITTSGAPERQGVVPRLDVGTSGLMVLAHSEWAYPVLKQALRGKAVDKTYQALVQGHPGPSSGTIDAPIGRHPGHEQKMAIVGGGQESVMHYETLEAHRAATLVEVSSETRRTHQIRVHFAAIGHPCCRDLPYGSGPALVKRLGLDRQWLHATRLAFEHLVEGNRVEFKSELPQDLEHALCEVRSD